MTVQECINYIDSIEPNAYTETQKAGWLSECEGKVYTALFLVQPYEFTPITAADSRTLALPAPYDRMYPRYLQAMIHYANGEYDRYANSMAVFNEVWAEANRWFGGDYDVTDRLRNKRFTAEISPELGDQVVMEIPEGCAVVAGRIVVEQEFPRTGRRYKFTEDMPYTWQFCFQVGSDPYAPPVETDTWYSFDITGNADLPNGFVAGDVLNLGTSYVTLYREGTILIAVTSDSHTGYELDWTCGIQAWAGESSEKVSGLKLLRERGAEPLPMILGDRYGTTLGVTLGPGFWNPDYENNPPGVVKLTGHLLIPDEEWAYDDRYSRRRDARWRG